MLTYFARENHILLGHVYLHRQCPKQAKLPHLVQLIRQLCPTREVDGLGVPQVVDTSLQVPPPSGAR